MSDYSRRSFLARMAAAPLIPFAVWFEKYAQAAPPMIRYDARSLKGQAMLKKYAHGVKIMMNTNSKDPRSWVFQWYTHWVKGPFGPATKQAEISNIYGPNPSPWKALAQDMWDTCQAHGPGEDENFFLPWHRMFVYFFERIVRSVTGHSFTLPYWNYSVGGAAHGVIPKQFRLPNDPIFKPLFINNRNPGVNQGHAIDQGQPDSPLGLSSLAQCTYEPQGAKQGFCLALDSGLHGNVHVLVGNGQNMGSVPFAAGDPIFWMHHCNIDRLWASWNRAGRANLNDAAFKSQTFIFADEHGNKVVAKVGQFLNFLRLRYTYDRFERVPICPLSHANVLAAAARRQRHFVKPGEPVELSAGPVRITLEKPPEVTTAVSFSSRVQALRPQRRLYVIVKNLNAQESPDVLYHVYLELPAGTTPDKGNAYYIGSLNFFDAVGHEGHGGGGTNVAEKFFSFDITQVAKSLRSKRLLSDKPTVTIVPVGEPASSAKAVVGEISLIEQ